MRTKVDKNNKTSAEKNQSISIASPKVVLDASDCARLLDGSGKTYVLLVEKDGKMVAANSRSPVQSSPATSSSCPASVESSEPVVSSLADECSSSATVAASQAQLCKNFVSASSDECSQLADSCKLDNSLPADSSETAECSKPAGSETVECSQPADSCKLDNSLPADSCKLDNSQPADSSETAECSQPASSETVECSQPADSCQPAEHSKTSDCSNHAECSQPAECSKCAEHKKPDNGELADISDTALIERLSVNNPQFSQDPEKSTDFKVILKPPKKRRGLHKKFENASPEALICGTITQSAVTSVGVAPDVGSVQTDASLSSPLNPSHDGARKHSIEHLLWHQSSPSVGTQSLISGNYSHESPTLILPQNDLPSSSVNTVSFSLSTPTPSISNSYTDEAQSHISELYSHSYNSAHHPVGKHILICQTSVTEHCGRTRSREHSPSLTHPDLLSAAQIAAQSACFHHLPEQVEPMNLSTSCKPHTSTDLDSQSSEDIPRVCSSQDSRSLEISKGRVPEMLQKTHEDIRVMNLNDTPIDVPQPVLPHPSFASDILNVNHSVHNSAIDLVALPEGREKEAHSVCRQPAFPEVSQTSDSVLLSSSNHSQVTVKASLQHRETKSCSLFDQSPASISKFSHSSKNESSLSEKYPCLGSQTCDMKSTNGVSEACQESPTCMEKEATSKTKRSPKKKVEIPMDERSRDERISRYSLIIDDVIANFVYVPEPLEEFSLTQAEEAAIRDQFEDIPSKVHTDINANQSKHDHVVSKTDTPDQTDLHMKADKLSTSSGTLNLVTSSKKCPNTVVQVTSDECSDVHATVENIDNVLAFVAGDVFNSVSQVSAVIKNTDTKKQTKTIRKLKKVGEAAHKNKKENNMLTPASALDREGSLCVTNFKQELASTEGDKTKRLVSGTTSDNGQLVQGANGVSKPRKTKKKKSDVGKCGKSAETSVLVQAGVTHEKSAIIETSDGLSQTTAAQTNTRKHPEGSLRVSKKRKFNGRGTVFAAASVAGQSDISADKDIVGLSRAETSDIGESIASTSGGSEQDTPVHELESKDELVSTDMQATENRDTGLESEEDANKPVRRYKKRLDFVKCDHCDHQSRGRSALSRHMKKVHMRDVTMPYRCQHCDYGCTKMASLNCHLFTHGVFPCSRCNHVADDRIKLTQHVVEEHKDKINMKLCKMCNRYIKCDETTIDQHTQQCQGPTPYRCTECDKVFRYASSLRVHYHTHFPNQPKRFGCEQCAYSYSTNYKANLHKHQKNMHACRDRDVQCPDCNKLFSTHDNMRRHRKVHTLVRPFACQTCEKTFKTQGALRGHQLIHTAIRPYMCNIAGCNRSFRTSTFMKNHQEEYHRLAPKKFLCTVEGCNYSFFKRSHLKRHAITHTGERNFHCTWPGCCKSFRHSDNLKVHFRAHTNDKPIRCHLCDFKCKQMNSLFWHKKQVHHVFDIMACPKRTDHKLAETTNALKTATLDADCSRATPATAGLEPGEDGSGQDAPVSEPEVDGQVGSVTIISETSACSSEIWTVVSEKTVSSVSAEASDKAAKNHEDILGVVENKDALFITTDEAKLVSCEQSVGTQTATREQGLLDLYEFKSDGESEEETPGHFRRDKNMLAILTPLPPPPKELLHRIELQEMKEKEKREKAEKKEQDKKEKAEKKELEKKEKAERKEIEKIERIRKKELEKKEKLEKKELEKKEKEEQKLSEKKEKIEKKEIEKKDKVDKKELEKKEKLEKKEQEKKEKLEKREQERQERIDKKEQEMKEKKEKQDQEKKGKEKQLAVNKAATEKLNIVGRKKNIASSRLASEELETVDNSATKKSPKRLQRTKSPVSATGSNCLVRSEMHTRSKRKLTAGNDDVVSKAEIDARKPGESLDTGISTPKRRKVATRKIEESSPVLSPRVTAVEKATATKRNALTEVKKKGRLPLPKRKPSARIKAKKKATLKTVKEVRKSPKASKVTLRNKPGRKKVVSEVKEMGEEKQQSEAEVETKVEDNVKVSEETDLPATEIQEEAMILPEKPLSPAYSEEMMLQGSASPYRGLSDGENLEDDETEVDETQDQSPTSVLSEEHSEAQNKSEVDGDLMPADKMDSFVMDRNLSQTVDDYSDNEVSNDIPLTPPRAPAPPPVESSEDEMEPEPELTPFSVPGPTTPFSVPGPTTPFSVPAPNTPFSVPPATNLMQQHSVHSEEAPVSALPSVASMEVHSQASVDMQQPLGSVEIHPHGSVEMNHPHGSVEMNHPHGSAEMHHSHGSVEMNRPHSSAEMHHSHGSVEMNHPHSSAEMHHSQGSVEMSHTHDSVELVHSLNSLEVQHSHRSISESLSHSEQNLSSIRTPESVIRDSNSNSMSEKYDLLPQSLQEQVQTSDADKEYFDQYLKSLSAANNRAANGGLGPSPSGLQQLEAMVCKTHLDSRDINSKSPISSLPISVITSLENTLSLLPHGDLRTRMDALVSDRHESLYVRDTPSSLARLPDHQTPLANHPCPTPTYDAFSPLNPLHPSATNSGRDSSYLRQPDKLFPTPPGSSSFMAEAMFQRQAMTTPFLPPHSDKSSLSRVPDAAHLRSSSSSSLLRRSGTVPGSDMFSSPAMTQAVPRHPFANTWAGQEMRPAHWQPPYLPRQPNMSTTGSFFPTKDSYLTGRNFMFDPSIRPAADRNMFSSLSSTQSQDSFQLDRFDLSNYFPNAMTPYGSSTASFDYSRSVHTSATKPFDDRYRQTSTSAAISDFRGLPSTSGSADMFPGLPSVNSSFNIYSGNPMSYHAQHMPDNVNSAFLAHPTTAQHAMFERDYASTAHRGLYPQNTPYSFLDERQYPGASKLAHAHPVPPAAVPQERNIMSRSSAADSQMQDPYRSMLYRY